MRPYFLLVLIFKKTSIFLYTIALFALIVVEMSGLRLASFVSDGKHLEMELSRGPFTVYDFPSKRAQTSAILFFGSGDGGWSGFEEAICHAFQDEGDEVIGIDSRMYAQTDYDLEVLQADYGKIAQQVRTSSGNPALPLIIGGYSMGAAQAIAAAGGPHPPVGLIGVLLVDPCSRGRYGLRTSDQMDVLPSGPGTFGVVAFASNLNSLRIVQWHASEDSIDSRSWLGSLKGEYRVFTFPNNGHHYDVNRPEFLQRLVQSAKWILNPKEDAAASQTKAGP